MNDKYLRQSGIVNPDKLKDRKVTIIGAGGIGAPTALALAKMGDFELQVVDLDGVSEWNQPSTLYGPGDVNKFKVDALGDILERLTGKSVYGQWITKIDASNIENLTPEILIAGTDNMASRKLLWEHFKKTPEIKCFIDARMSGEAAQVYCIKKFEVIGDLRQGGHDAFYVEPGDVKFYESMWFPDSEADEQPCTARAIIYNTFMIASVIARLVKGYCNGEAVPKETIIDMFNLTMQTNE